MEVALKTICSTRPAPQIEVWQSWVTGLLAGLNRWWSIYLAWRFERAAIRQLGSLSDRQLKDIGLHRSEIMRAVRGRRSPVLSRYY
jgi:uncharacterized protein YjiS (DUF1127 family)